MKNSAQKADPTPSWKQEVNRRIAEHKERKGEPASQPEAPAETLPAGSAAAMAAARVAARYAKAPSYSEMLAEEARAAVRAAEMASRAALDAQARAESILAGLEAGLEADRRANRANYAEAPALESPSNPPIREADASLAPILEVSRTSAAEPRSLSPNAAQSAALATPQPSFEIRYDADLPVRESRVSPARTSRGEAIFEVPAETLWQHSDASLGPVAAIEVVEAAQPIHANLIHFPKELIATRKARPRRAEGPYAASLETEGQLSIFEVEPSAISTQPAAAGAAVEAGSAAWTGPDWSGIELDDEPHVEFPVAAVASRAERSKPVRAVLNLHLAPLNQRLLATLVDFSLAAAAFLAAALVFSLNARHLPPLRVIEVGSIAGLALSSLLYQAFFFCFSSSTLGMKYARVELSTYAGREPRIRQRLIRAGAVVISMLPAGLGGLWAIFDEQNLSWHDRLSRTYLRK